MSGAAAAVRGTNQRAVPWLMAGLAAVTGIASSAVAVALRQGVHWLFHALAPLRHGAAGVVLPAAGAFAGMWVVRSLFREPGGHGVPAVLDAVSRHGGFMRKRSVFSRLLGALLNVASGGSAGLEGPIVYSAAAVGSNLATAGRLAERQRVLLLACGVAGGIAAVFNAPLTGLIFAAEVVLAEWSLSSLIPLAVCAIVATEIGRMARGEAGAFVAGEFDWGGADLLASGVLGAASGLLAVVLVRAIFQMEHWGGRVLRRWSAPRRAEVWAAAAGLGVGVIGWLHPMAIGEGYQVVNRALEGRAGDGLPLLLGLLAAKLAATTLTLGSNAPGGIFAPSLVLGALLGAAFGRALEAVAPGADFAAAGFYSLVAMAGLVAGTMQAPLTGIFLALETTGGWSHSLPLILVAVLSTLVSRSLLPYSFYTWELARSGRLLRPGTDQRILAEFTVGEMLDAESATIPAGSTLEDLVRVLPNSTRNHFAVVHAEDGRLLGMLSVISLRPFLFDEILRRVTPVDTVMDPAVPAVRKGDSLLDAMAVFERTGAWVLPVVGDNDVFLGTISKSTIFDRYRRELIVQTAERHG